MATRMRPLRILHVTPYFADAWAYGGIPRIANSLARGLVRHGHSVTVVTTDACDESSRLPTNGARPSRYRAWTPFTREGVDVRVFPNVSNALAYHWQMFLPVGLAAYLRRHVAGFDVAHLHACRNVPGAIAARELRRARVPYVLAPNGTAPLIERRHHAKRAFDVVAGRRVLRDAARVIAVSRAEVRQLSGVGVSGPRVCLIPNPVEVDEFSPPLERGRFRRRFELAPGPLVLFLGKLTPRKRLDLVVRAFHQLSQPRASLVIAGNDMGAAAGIRAQVRALGLADRTVFTGLLRGRERLEALADADVVVYPSQQEIFGLVALESLLAGTPVIVADDCGCGEVIASVGGGRVVPLGDVVALSHGIEELLAAPAVARAAAATAALRVRTEYGADIVCAQLTQVYEDMISENERQTVRVAEMMATE